MADGPSPSARGQCPTRSTPTGSPAPGHSRRRRLTGPVLRVGRRHALHGGAGRGRLRRRRRRALATSIWCSPTGPSCSVTPTRSVTAAITRAAALGTTFGAPTPGEVLLAEAICDRVPGCEQVRLVSSGTEAAMSAVRLARGVTGRDRVVKFDGCYHGHSDGLLAGGGSGVAMLGLAGIGRRARRERWPTPSWCPTTWCPSWTDEVACVIVEPVAANMNLVAPRPGFLAGLRACLRCRRRAADLRRGHHRVSDRAAGAPPPGPASHPICGASARSSAAACPSAPSVGAGSCWPHWRREGPVYQAGTLSGNPLATAAGLAVLSGSPTTTTPSSRPGWRRLPRDLASAIAGRRPGGGRPRRRSAGRALPRSRCAGAETDRPPDRLRDRARAGLGNGVYPRFFHAMLRRGRRAARPVAYEVMFPGLAHGDDVLERVVEPREKRRPKWRRSWPTATL